MRDDAVLQRRVLCAPLLGCLLRLRHLRSGLQRQGLGFRLQGLGRISGLWFRVTGSFGFRVTRNPLFMGFGVQGFCCIEWGWGVLDFGAGIQDDGGGMMRPGSLRRALPLPPALLPTARVH